jgi:serine/threonine-protein kinase
VTEDSKVDEGGAIPDVDDTDPRLGSVVDKFTIVGVLGRGGMGAVYEARHARLSRRVAIKFLLPELARNREILRRFENEAKAAGQLEHPNLAAVTDLGRSEDGAPYLVMEFLQGEDLSKLLRRIGPLPVCRAIDIVLQACWGLAVAHKAGIVHRDLKPENLFLAEMGDGGDFVKVLDFGIAKLRSPDGSFVTSTGTTFGTAHYMSPEQARGAAEVDERTDVWSLGVVLYELLSGRKPFEGDQFLHVVHQILSVEPPALASLRPGLPPALITAVARAMAKDAAGRFRTIQGFADALSPFGTRARTPRREPGAVTLGTAPTPLTAAPQVTARTGRRKSVVAAATTIVAVGVITTAFLLSRSRRPEPVRSPRPVPPVAEQVPAPSTRTVPAPIVEPLTVTKPPSTGPIPRDRPLVPAAATERSSGHEADTRSGEGDLQRSGTTKAPKRTARSNARQSRPALDNASQTETRPGQDHPTKIDSDNPY